MTLPNESFVGVAPDGSGKSIRNLTVTTLINGVPTTVQIQVVAITDPAGNVIDDFMDYQWKAQVIHELRALRQEMQLLHGGAIFETEPAIGGMR